MTRMSRLPVFEAARRANAVFRYRRHLRERRGVRMTLLAALREWCWRFRYEWSRGS